MVQFLRFLFVLGGTYPWQTNKQILDVLCRLLLNKIWSRMEKIWRQGTWTYVFNKCDSSRFCLTSLRYQFNLLSESNAVFETVYVHWTPENALKTSREESESVRSKSPLYLGSSHQAHKASERSGGRETDRQTDRSRLAVASRSSVTTADSE